MNKNTIILVVSLAIILIISITPVQSVVKLVVMALALLVIIYSRRATFYFVTANKNYMSKDPEKRKKSIDEYKKALQLGGLPDNYTISAASLLIQNGASIKDVQLRLGHASIKSTLEIYTHYNKNASQKSIDIMEDILNVDKS